MVYRGLSQYVWLWSGRITTDGALTQYKLPVRGAGAQGIASDGTSLWFTINDGMIGMIPAGASSGTQIRTFPVATSAAASLYPPILAAGGVMWFLDSANYAYSFGTVTSNGSTASYPTCGRQCFTPEGMTLGPDGAIWATDRNATLLRTTTSGQTSVVPISGAVEPWGIATGADGSLWFTDYDNNAIGRVQ